MKDKISSLINNLGLTKEQLYKVWKEYNELSSKVGKANAISEIIIGINEYPVVNNYYEAFKFFIILGFESINKEYFKEIENNQKEKG